MLKKKHKPFTLPSGSLVDHWQNNRPFFDGKGLRQIIPLAGDGQLGDDKESSRQFRSFLAELPLVDLTRYADECLRGMEDKKRRFPDAGLALQDVINETGTRIGFSVAHGRYQGLPGQSGHDGLWRVEDDPRTLIVEVKTSDRHRLSLDATVAKYRRLLATESRVDSNSAAFLVVVGREDTGGLEAQIRGSRYAWDCRMISVDALMRLAKLREETDSLNVARQIREILFPKEFTKLDEIVEALFLTAEDSKQGGESAPVKNILLSGKIPMGGTHAILAFQDGCMDVAGRRLKRHFSRRARSFYSASGGHLGALCFVSRFHETRRMFWYTIYAPQKESAIATPEAYFVLGCGSPDNVLLIPKDKFFPLLDLIPQHSHKDRGKCWHVKILLREGRLIVSGKKGTTPMDLTDFLISSGKRELGDA